MGHAAKLVGDVGMSRDERSMLLGKGDEAGGGPAQQLLGVLTTMRETAQSVVDGRAGRRWADECMNQLILGVEVALGQGWGELVDAFTDAGRILQSYENGNVTAEAAPFLVEAYDLMCALVSDAMSGDPSPGVMAQWRGRYQREVTRLEIAGVTLVSDDDSGADESAESRDAFAFPDLSKNIVRLRPQDDLPTLDELPPLDTMLGGAASRAKGPVQQARADIAPPLARKDVTRPSRFEEARAQEDASAASRTAAAEPALRTVQPSRIIVEFVDRICDELGGLPQRSADDRALSIETIQGGIAALKREAISHGHSTSAELCDEMLKACMLMGEGHAEVDESFTDLGFAFCGVFVEAMGNSTSENVNEWRVECRDLVEAWLELATRPDASEAEVAAVNNVTEIAEAASPMAPEPQDEGLWIGSAAAPETEETIEIVQATIEAPVPAVSEPLKAAVPEPVAPVAIAPVSSAPVVQAALSRPAQMPSADLFVRAQEALARGDAEAAKGLALQAAAMIAESEVERADQRLRDAEARLKANVTATEDARGDVKNTEKLVMNAASEVAAGETALGLAKSHTAKMTHELQESEMEVADLERQIAELQARLAEQMTDVARSRDRLDEAKGTETAGESQLDTLRDSEKETRKELEAARQRVKDRQRGTAEIESEMDRAREMLSRQRTSLADIKQTISRPEPIKTGGQGNGSDPLLF